VAFTTLHWYASPAAAESCAVGIGVSGRGVNAVGEEMRELNVRRRGARGKQRTGEKLAEHEFRISEEARRRMQRLNRLRRGLGLKTEQQEILQRTGGHDMPMLPMGRGGLFQNFVRLRISVLMKMECEHENEYRVREQQQRGSPLLEARGDTPECLHDDPVLFLSKITNGRF